MAKQNSRLQNKIVPNRDVKIIPSIITTSKRNYFLGQLSNIKNDFLFIIRIEGSNIF